MYLLEHSSPTIMSIVFLLVHYGCVEDTFADDCQISGVYENACCICMRILVYTRSDACLEACLILLLVRERFGYAR